MTVNTDGLRRIVAALATADGRAVGTAGHAAARRFLLAELRSADLEPYAGKAVTAHEHPFRLGGVSFTNLLGVLPGAAPEARPVLLAAHYDTCGPYPGADDNAAAIAILLETIQPLRAAGLGRPVVFACDAPNAPGPDAGHRRVAADLRPVRKGRQRSLPAAGPCSVPMTVATPGRWRASRSAGNVMRHGRGRPITISLRTPHTLNAWSRSRRHVL